MMLRRVIGGVLLSLMLLGTMPALAAGPLDLVPENASIVLRLKTPEQTIVKVGNYVNNGVPGVGFLIQGQAPAMGVLISNPTLGGVDLKQDWYVATFVQKNAQPQVVFIIPTTDDKALEEAVGENFSFVTHDKWVAYSQDEAAIELVKACKEGKSKSIGAGLDKRATDLCENSEVSAYLNLVQLREIYAEEFEEADEKLNEGIEAIKNLTAGAAAQNPGMNLDAVWDFYGKIGHALIQGARDSQSFTIGVQVTDQNLALEELFLVKKGTKSDLLLQKNEPDELRVLTKLPQDQLGYFALHGDAKGMIKSAMELASSMFGENDDAKAKVEKFSAEMKDLKYGSIGGAFGLAAPSPEGVIAGIIVTEVTPAAKMLKLSREMSSGYKLEIPGIKQEITVKEGAEKIGDASVDLIKVKQEISEEADPLQIQKHVMEIVYGKDGVTQRLTTVNDHVVQTVGGGSDLMKTAIDSVKQPSSASSSPVTASRTRQLGKANLIGMIDIPNFAVKAMLIANDVAGKDDIPPLPIPLPVNQLKGLKIAPNFVTFAVGTEPEGLRMRTEVPAATVMGFYKIFQTMQAAQRQPRQ